MVNIVYIVVNKILRETLQEDYWKEDKKTRVRKRERERRREKHEKQERASTQFDIYITVSMTIRLAQSLIITIDISSFN